MKEVMVVNADECGACWHYSDEMDWCNIVLVTGEDPYCSRNAGEGTDRHRNCPYKANPIIITMNDES